MRYASSTLEKVWISVLAIAVLLLIVGVAAWGDYTERRQRERYEQFQIGTVSNHALCMDGQSVRWFINNEAIAELASDHEHFDIAPGAVAVKLCVDNLRDAKHCIGGGELMHLIRTAEKHER